MKLLLINPNTTASMTVKAEAAARAVMRSDTELIATNSHSGPASIEGFYDIAVCLPGLLEEAGRYPDVDAIVIACFDDTGLDAMRCQVGVPVIGTPPDAIDRAEDRERFQQLIQKLLNAQGCHAIKVTR